jgi:putative transposase
VWDCKDHLVWTTKDRYTVLAGDEGNRCWQFLREIARRQEMAIDKGMAGAGLLAYIANSCRGRRT